jgi:tRNA pseudouridine38-40 synthase
MNNCDLECFNCRLTIAYDGTYYHGWQIQQNANTIQAIIEQKIKIILNEDVRVIGSGRTDTGVHAKGQVAHFKHHKPIQPYRFLGSLNGLLPKDIRILKVEHVPLDFHAQHRAIGKTYHYHLHLDRVQDPFKRLYTFQVKEKIDLAVMHEAAQHFLGTHDFISFANEAHTGCAAYDSVRTLKRLDIVHEEGGVRLELEADGFLYKMVRNIVGILLEISAGKRPVSDIHTVFEAKDRRSAGPAVPPQGLFLIKVFYPY